EPGPGGGGGGGGNHTPEPPRHAELPGKDRTTIPAAKPRPVVAPEPAVDAPPRLMAVDIPAQPLASGHEILPGSIDAPSLPPTASQGAGSGGGAGTGAFGGDGPGRGRGYRDGVDGNTGGRVRGPGDGTSWPVPIFQPRPNYTSDAMRAHLQGTVLL